MRKTNVALASAFIVILASTTAANASKCPDITTQRSEFVKNQFDASLLVGLWYEHMYIDIAQLGASCERLNATYNDATGVVTSDFIVKYGELPFSITEVYTPPVNNTIKGYYVKTVKEPGSKFLQIPTVVSDVQMLSSSSSSTYDTLILTSCVEKLGEAIRELVFATRKKNESSELLGHMENTARSLGIQYTEKQLKQVDWSKKICDNSSIKQFL